MGDQSDLRTGSRSVADYRALEREQAEAVGLTPPAAWDSYRPAFFRLPGVDGSALFLRATVFPDDRSEVLAVDVGLLDVQAFLWVFGRELTPGFAARLSAFFIAVAGEDRPSGSFHDNPAGLHLEVEDSDAAEVQLMIRLVPDNELSLRTTRSALMQAGLEVRRLEPTADDPTIPDWL